jgi:hypothetical protein
MDYAIHGGIFFNASRARSGVIGPRTTSRMTPWPSIKNVAGSPLNATPYSSLNGVTAWHRR